MVKFLTIMLRFDGAVILTLDIERFLGERALTQFAKLVAFSGLAQDRLVLLIKGYRVLPLFHLRSSLLLCLRLFIFIFHAYEGAIARSIEVLLIDEWIGW